MIFLFSRFHLKCVPQFKIYELLYFILFLYICILFWNINQNWRKVNKKLYSSCDRLIFFKENSNLIFLNNHERFKILNFIFGVPYIFSLDHDTIKISYYLSKPCTLDFHTNGLRKLSTQSFFFFFKPVINPIFCFLFLAMHYQKSCH